MSKKYKILFILIGLFILDAIFVITNNINIIDYTVYNSIRSLNSDFFDYFFRFITIFGNVDVVLLILVILNIKLSRKDAITCDILACVSTISNLIIKNIIQRSRPDVLRLIEIDGFSFPSGHSMIAITLYGYLFYIVNRKVNNKKIKIILEIFILLLIIGICLSRIYLGVHYFTDIFGGVMLGLAELIFIILLDNKSSGGDKSV